MFLRIVGGIKHHFDIRFSEWAMGGTLVWWGLRLVGENDAWANPLSWQPLLELMPENYWGWLAIIIGIFRLAALVVNGTFEDTAYSRYSPLVRGVTALFSACLWFLVFISVLGAGTSGGGIYHLPLVLEIWCLRTAWKDVGRLRAMNVRVVE